MAYQHKNNTPAIPIKFASALDTKSGKVLELAEVRNIFFKAANDPVNPKRAIKTLRETFNLVCPNCKQAELTFSFGSENPDRSVRKIAGSNLLGQLSHIKTKGKSAHTKSCIATVFPQESLHPIDYTKGYKINLNLKEPVDRNPRNGQLVSRAANNRVISYDKDLMGREVKTISVAEQLNNLITTEVDKGRATRLGQSVVVYGTNKTPWKSFFLRNDDRIKHFVSSAVSKELPTPPTIKTPPVALTLEFNAKTIMSTYSDEMGKTQIYKFPMISGIKNPMTGKELKVQPQLHVENEHLFQEMKDTHRSYGQLFVIAANPELYKADNNPDLYILKMKLNDPDMIHKPNRDILSNQPQAQATQPA